VWLDVDDPRAALRGDACERCDLREYEVRDRWGGHVRLEAAEILAIRVARMGADRDAVAESLLDRRAHGGFIAGVASSCVVRRCDGAHQVFLGAVGDGFRELADVAIQVDTVHSMISSLEVTTLSCSSSSPRAV